MRKLAGDASEDDLDDEDDDVGSDWKQVRVSHMTQGEVGVGEADEVGEVGEADEAVEIG